MDMNHTPSPCRRSPALIACPDCNRDVSYRAPHCVHCGRPNPGGCPMGKVGVILGIAILGLTAVVAMKSAKCHRMDSRSQAISIQTCGHEGDWNAALSRRVEGTGYLGVRCEDGSATAVLELVGKGSPAEKIGILVGDRIVKIDGADIACYHDVLGAIWKRKPGDEVKVEVRRGAETRIFEVALDRHPND